MKNKGLIVLCFVMGIATFTFAKGEKYSPPASDRVRTNLDNGWRFYRGDVNGEEETHQVNKRPWQNVTLPHEWSIEGPFSKEHNTTQGFLPMEIGWYRNGLRFPDSYEDKKIFILFDGVYRESDVWMNYAYLGHHQSGYTSFFYDLTDYVRTGNRTPNGLRVRVDARRHEEDMYEGSGIYRHVWIITTNKMYIPIWGTFVHTPEVTKSSATIEVKTKIKNEHAVSKNCQLITKITNADGIVVAEMVEDRVMPANSEFEFVQNTNLSKPHLWGLDDPYLYKAHSIVKDGEKVVDTFETRFGIRFFHFDSDKGFFLNGEHVKLKGFNAHYDFAGIGTAIPDRIHRELMIRMKKAGFNFYRSSHNPATVERLDVCDEMGIMVWDEIERKLESAEIEMPLVRETITRDRNHPSIILWSLENESPLESTTFGANIIKKGTELAHELDPGRFTTFAASMPVNKKGYGEAADVVSYNYHWERGDADHIDFPHWKIGLISEYAAARARRGVYGMEYFDVNKEDLYTLYFEDVQTMYEMSTRVESYWRRIKAREYLGGGCMWSGVDAWGEGNTWPLNSRGDGVLDLCFFPKDVYYYFKSQFTEEPMVHMFPHWNWDKQKNEKIEVWGYTNCDEMELFVNGNSQGSRKKPLEPAPWKPEGNKNVSAERSETAPEHVAWQVPYQPGTIRAVGKRNGKVVCSQEINTAGEPAKIELSIAIADFIDKKEIMPLVADGKDIVIVKAAILDKDGNLVPTAHNLINFFVEGDEKIIGVGNGDITSHEPNKATYRKAYNGLCVAIVQSTTKAGEFIVTAAAQGLKSDQIKITSVPPQPVDIEVTVTPV